MNNLMLMNKNQYTNMQQEMHQMSEDQIININMSVPQNSSQPPQSDNLLSALYNQNILYLKLMENIEKNTYINNFYQQFNQQLIQQNNVHNSLMHSLLTRFVLQNSLISTQVLLNFCNNDNSKEKPSQSSTAISAQAQQELTNSKVINLEIPSQQATPNDLPVIQQSQSPTQSNSNQIQSEENNLSNDDSNNQDLIDENILEGLTDISISSIDLEELQIYTEMDLDNIFTQKKGLSKKDIKKIPLYVFQGKKKGFELLEDFYGLNKKSKKIKKNNQHPHQCKEKNTDSTTNLTCCICLCEYKKGSKVRELSCGHKFHCSCIDKWLQKNSKCPYCKKSAITN